MSSVQSSEWRAEYEAARQNLGLFVVEQAHASANIGQFGWIAVPDAPNVYEDLTEAYERSRVFGAPLPISSLHNEHSVYGSAESNIAFRFWHDVLHCRTGLTFALPDEVAQGLHHVRIVEEAFGAASVERDIVRFDLVAQNYFIAVTRQFPVNQERFVRTCLLRGLDEAILAEHALTRLALTPEGQ